MKAYGITHVGNVRSTNEDTVLIEHWQQPYYALVADGMGGHAAGEIASALAAKSIQEYIAALEEKSLDEDQIVDAIQFANRSILDQIEQHPEYHGMGTTLTFAYIEPTKLTIGHVGDSSAFLVGRSGIKKITKDHTYMQKLIDSGVLDSEAAPNFPYRNIITRALGTDQLQVDIYKEKWRPGDRLLLCSDGLTIYTDRNYLYRQLSKDTPQVEEHATALLEYALKAGGRDNISVVIVENTGARGDDS